ncbi:hypothetical protein [uncultured Hydrogenophaga sp.]|uniref:hypothetical protein n=1 Tax=uncultured Hydrogenophaga sp. TaxID=199683 RepID=UPI00265EC044|nr:hypothetical protein [uncultured Hydrogenophaga sp.]
MKQTEMIVLGLAGLAVYLIWRSQTPTRTVVPQDGKPAGWVSEIFGMGSKPFDNGWRYFDNGVAIDPSGNYYQNGAMVWQAPGSGI